MSGKFKDFTETTTTQTRSAQRTAHNAFSRHSELEMHGWLVLPQTAHLFGGRRKEVIDSPKKNTKNFKKKVKVKVKGESLKSAA